jgi:hypothetical protein
MELLIINTFLCRLHLKTEVGTSRQDTLFSNE